MSAELEALGAKISGALLGAVTDVKVAYGELTLTVVRDRWLEVAAHLRKKDRKQIETFKRKKTQKEQKKKNTQQKPNK
jgi:hypothetical protein